MKNVQELKDKIEAMSPPDQLRLAAALLEQHRPDLTRLAYTVVRRVSEGLGAALCFERPARVQP